MAEWRAYHVYYTNTDRILLECIAPLLHCLERDVELCFWERHYAGGPHIRVRFHADPASLNSVSTQFLAAVENYLELFPSETISGYSADDARRLLEMEGEAYQPDDLTYRTNAVCQRPYQRLNSRYIQGKGLELLHEFMHDSNPLSEAILKDPTAKLDHLLRMYFLNALFATGSLVHGSVSYKSHWSGFAASFTNPELPERIRASFETQQEAIISTMLEVQRRYKARDFSSDPALQQWFGLLQRYGEKAMAILRSGEQISMTMTSEEIRKYRESFAQKSGSNEFMMVLLEDERFIAAFRHEAALAWPRVLTNLLYMVIPTLGLTVLDRMALCYFAHCAVELHFQCDLTDTLRSTIAAVLSKTDAH